MMKNLQTISSGKRYTILKGYQKKNHNLEIKLKVQQFSKKQSKSLTV